jgi:hypothetical protein
MEDSIMTLQGRIDGGTGAHLQDGGHAVSDVLGQLPEERWDDLVRDFLLL